MMNETARVIVNSVAYLRKDSNVLIICGRHNKAFAELLMLESYIVGAYPYLWEFNEKLFQKYSEKLSENVIGTLPMHIRSLLENSHVIIWLSQFSNWEGFPVNVRRGISSFWDAVDNSIKTKPRLLVTLLSAECIEDMGINHRAFLRSFANAVNVDYGRLRETGNAIASKLNGKKLIHVSDTNGTDLTFSIDKRHVGVEVGTLEDCFSIGRECEVEIPAGEVYVAPVETSANGILIVEEFRDYDIQNLQLHFKEGKIVSFKADKGSDVFRDLLRRAEGDKDRIAELGIGTNYGMKPIGYRLYDEKALGTVHIAIGNNLHLGGVNRASIHYDFVLYKPDIEADNMLIMHKGKLLLPMSNQDMPH